MAIRMAEMHFAHVPRFVGRRHGDVEPGSDTNFMHLVHVVDPNRHPYAAVRRLVAFMGEGGSVGALAAPALRALAEKNAGFTGTDRAESRRIAPVPELLPAP